VSFAAWLLHRYVLHATQQQQQQQPHMELELSSQTLNYAHALCARHDSQPTANQKRGQKPKAKSRAKNQATNLHIQIQISDFQTFRLPALVQRRFTVSEEIYNKCSSNSSSRLKCQGDTSIGHGDIDIDMEMELPGELEKLHSKERGLNISCIV